MPYTGEIEKQTSPSETAAVDAIAKFFEPENTYMVDSFTDIFRTNGIKGKHILLHTTSHNKLYILQAVTTLKVK